MRFLVRLGISALALWVAAEIVPRMIFDGGIGELALVALAFGLVNAIIRPIVMLLTLPLTLVTFGLFGLVVNGLMLLLVANFSESLNIEGGFFTQVLAATVAAVVVTVVSAVASQFLPDGR